MRSVRAGALQGGETTSLIPLFREVDAGDLPVSDRIDRDDFELLFARTAADILMIDDRIADGDAVDEARFVVRIGGKCLGVTRAQSVAARFCNWPVEPCHNDVLRITGDIGIEILPVIGIELPLDEVYDTAHRSISPKTMSIEPSTAETSA